MAINHPDPMITIDRRQILLVVDSLGSAQTRCEALGMCSSQLDKTHGEVVSFLAYDADDILTRTIETLMGLLSDEKEPANG